MESTTAFLNTPARARTSTLRGFTVVELLVALGIILIITTIVITGQTNFNRSLVLTDTTYTVAFTLRQAQSLGLSSRKFGTTQNAGYGVNFVSGANTTYTLFADTEPVAPGNAQSGACVGHSVTSGLDAKPGNCLYDSTNEKVTTYTIGKGFTISSFCGADSGGTQRCSGSYLDSLAISFLRPNTQANIVGVRSGTLIPLTSATITISSPDGSQTRCIKVTKVGQIAVGPTCQ